MGFIVRGKVWQKRHPEILWPISFPLDCSKEFSKDIMTFLQVEGSGSLQPEFQFI